MPGYLRMNTDALVNLTDHYMSLKIIILIKSKLILKLLLSRYFGYNTRRDCNTITIMTACYSIIH